MTFEEIMQFTRTVSSHAAFEDEECEAYFNVLMSLPQGAFIVEIGLEYGRSSSIALQVAKEHALRYIGIDPFTGHPEIHSAWLKVAQAASLNHFAAIRMVSHDVVIAESIHCILIDGDHSYEAVSDDLHHFVPYVVDGGFACLHDCARESLPDVIKAAKEYFGTDEEPHPQWKKYQQAGTLAIWQRK